MTSMTNFKSFIVKWKIVIKLLSQNYTLTFGYMVLLENILNLFEIKRNISVY